ncbi:MAG TPA: cupredoxin domain-containing protein [bacterium]|nr:cupredoxin domain-containing protein [bacterium]
MIRMRRLTVLLGLLVVLSAGQASASHTGLLFGASSRVVVTMTEWKFSPATLTLPAGESVALVLENTGTQSHVFMVYPAPKTPYKQAGDWWEYVLERTYFQGMGEILVHRRYDFVVSGTRLAEVAVEPGKTVTLTFTPVKKGRFEIGCHLPAAGGSHYAAGMKGLLIVR